MSDKDLVGRRALVTGASSGIGAAIARALHACGATLVLPARRRGALEALAAELGDAEVITGDLGQPGGAASVWAAAAARPVDILINNAGFGYFRPFSEVDWERDAELVQLNITSLVELARRFVAQGTGRYLVNIASIGAYQSVPNMALYAASKAFVRNFSEGLHDELRGTTRVTCVCPGGTRTEFHAVAGAGNYGWLANKSMMTAEEVARISVRAMLAGKRTVIPGLMNKLSCFGVRFVPRRIASWLAGRVRGKPRPGALPPRLAA